jgi:hypothetical protein
MARGQNIHGSDPERGRRDVAGQSSGKASDDFKSPWDYLNSPFGIWFLSSIILASITFLGTWFHATLQTKRLNQEKRIAVAVEISVRCKDFIEACKNAEKGADYEYYNKLWAAYWTLESSQYRLIQFKDAPLDELVYELKILDPATGKQVDATLDKLYKILHPYPYTPEDRQKLCSNLEAMLDRGVIDPLHANAGDQ